MNYDGDLSGKKYLIYRDTRCIIESFWARMECIGCVLSLYKNYVASSCTGAFLYAVLRDDFIVM